MRFHKFTIDYRKDRDYKDFLNKGYFLHLHDDADTKDLGSIHCQVILRKPTHRPIFAARLSVGSRASETPWDGHIQVLGSGFFWGFTWGRKLAHWLTNGKREGYRNREWSMRLDGSTLYHNLWMDGAGCIYETPEERRKRRKRWFKRSGALKLSPLYHIWGPVQYFYQDLRSSSWRTQLAFENEDVYPVSLMPRLVTKGRKKSKKREIIGVDIDVDAPKGVPYCVDHSGGWKGDRVYGFSVRTDWDVAPIDWHEEAINLVHAYIMKERVRTGFVKPDPV